MSLAEKSLEMLNVNCDDLTDTSENEYFRFKARLLSLHGRLILLNVLAESAPLSDRCLWLLVLSIRVNRWMI